MRELYIALDYVTNYKHTINVYLIPIEFIPSWTVNGRFPPPNGMKCLQHIELGMKHGTTVLPHDLVKRQSRVGEIPAIVRLRRDHAAVAAPHERVEIRTHIA